MIDFIACLGGGGADRHVLKGDMSIFYMVEDDTGRMRVKFRNTFVKIIRFLKVRDNRCVCVQAAVQHPGHELTSWSW